MPIISPTARFWIAVATTIAIGISQGTLNLTGAVPANLIHPLTAWCGIIAFVASAVTAAASGAGLTTANKLASAASVPEVSKIEVKPTQLTQPSIDALDKVVAK